MKKLLALLIIFPFCAIAQDETTDTLVKQIDYLQNRHEVLAKNIANVSTPKYVTQDLEKPEFIDKKDHKVAVKKVRLAVTNKHHIKPSRSSNGQYTTKLDKTDPMKPNKNNVDLSKQITRMAMNSDQTSEALKNYRSSMDLVGIASSEGAGGGH